MAMSKGCTVALIVVAAILLLIIVGLIVIWINKDKIVEAGIDYIIQTTEDQIVTNLPDGYTPETVHELMAELKTAIKNGEIPGPEIQRLAETFQQAMGDNEIDKEEGAHLLEMIQEALGKELPPPVDSLPDTLQAVPDSA